jgi:hypothetical protein
MTKRGREIIFPKLIAGTKKRRSEIILSDNWIDSQRRPYDVVVFHAIIEALRSKLRRIFDS